MGKHPVSETNHGLVMQPEQHKLSIRISPDGLSYAFIEDEKASVSHLRFQGDDLAEELKRIAASFPHWKSKNQSIRVCVVTDRVALIPEELDQSESYHLLLRTQGTAPDPDARFITTPCGEGRALLYAPDRRFTTLVEAVWGDDVSYVHSLEAGLNQPENEAVSLYVDIEGAWTNMVLCKGPELLFTAVLPFNSGTSVLFAVNRLLISEGVDACRIICSGDNCQANVDLLKNYYHNVSVHPDKEDRNLLFALR